MDWKLVALILGAIVVFIALASKLMSGKHQNTQNSLPEELPSYQRPEARSDTISPVLREASVSSPAPVQPSVAELMRRVETASSVAEVWKVLELTNDEAVTSAGHDRIGMLIRSDLRTTTTVAECLDLYDETPRVDEGSDALGDAVLVRALELARDFDSCNEIAEKFENDWPSDEYEDKVREKQLSFATTFEQVFEFCDSFDETSAPYFERALVLATSSPQVLEIYEQLEEDYEDNEFSRRVLEKATDLAASFEECDNVRGHVVTDDDEMDNRIVAKTLTLVTTVEECESIWDGLELDTSVARAAICRAADIIRAEP